MAESLEIMRRRIHGVEELRSIVRTMKSLAAVSIRRYERGAAAAALQADTLEAGMHAFLVHHATMGPLPARPEGDRVAAIVLGSDQGMCGPFNERLARFVAEHASSEGVAIGGPLLAVGARIAERLRHVGYDPEEVLPAAGSLAGVTPVVEHILLSVEAWLSAGRCDRLVVLHNYRQRGTASRPRRLHLYPVPRRWLRELQRRPWPQRGLPIFKLPAPELLSALTHELLFASLFRALAQSLESENASRLQAMQAAERNIDDQLEELEQAFRQQRQSSIDAELLDIVSGYEASSAADER